VTNAEQWINLKLVEVYYDVYKKPDSSETVEGIVYGPSHMV